MEHSGPQTALMAASGRRMSASGCSEFRQDSILTMSSTANSIDTFPGEVMLASFRGSGSSGVFRHVKPPETRSGRAILPYVTRHSDSGFGSALSSSGGSSCSFLPPPPPYRAPPRSAKQHRIHRSFSDSKYQANPLPGVMALEAQRQIRGTSWQSRASILSYEPNSPSPSMSTVSCPEYPELQEKLHRLSMARDSLSLQVAVLTEQVGAQKEKIRDLETMLVMHNRGSKAGSNHDVSGIDSRRHSDDHELDYKKMDLIAEVSNLKLKYASLEREKQDTERKLRMSQNEIDHLSNSLHGLGTPISVGPATPQQAAFATNPYMQMAQRTKEQQEEMEQLRQAVARLISDNETKNHQINRLRNALDEHCRQRDECYQSPNGRWQEPSQHQYDFNAQLRRLLLEDPTELAHSTSYPVSLCSSALHGSGMDRTPRSAVQSSSSYTSSLSTASPQHSWSQSGTPRHLLHPNQQQLQQQPASSYRSPSSPAARQLAAELDELRRLGDQMAHQHNFASTSLPRGMGVKAASTLALPGQKLSIASGASAGEWGGSSAGGRRHNYRSQVNRWFADKLRRKKRAVSVPNLVESDDEIARGRASNAPSQSSSKLEANGTFRRDRTRSSLRNLFSKLKRSTSQDQGTFRRGSAARSTSTARLGTSGPLSGAIALRPAAQQFVDWRSDHVAEWIGEIGYPQYVPEVANYVRSGRHLLNMSGDELEREVGIKNPLHRKRLLLILRRIEDDVLEPVDKWDLHQVLRWLEDIGLPQYKDTFTEFLIDGITLENLTAADIVEMRITNGAHYATLARSIQFLKMVKFRPQPLERKFDPSIVQRYPCPNAVVRWSHAATCEWLRTIDLAEFTPNLLCAGVPGAVMIYEPSFTAETLAEILQMPPHKTLLRRHLTSHYNQLIGQKLIAEKRDWLAQGIYPQLMPNVRIKVLKKGFSLTRKKAKNEICVEPEELLCPPDINHKFPMTAQSLLESLDSSNV